MLPSSSTRPAAAFTAQQLRQFRAQCIVFLAFKNQMEPRKLHLEIAVGGCVVPAARGEHEIDGFGCHGETTSSRSQASSSSAAPLPLPHLLPVSSLWVSPPVSATEQENRHRDDDPAAKHE